MLSCLASFSSSKEAFLRPVLSIMDCMKGKERRTCRINSHQASYKARQINVWPCAPLKIYTILVSFLRNSLERVTSLLVTGFYTVNLLDLVRWRGYRVHWIMVVHCKIISSVLLSPQVYLCRYTGSRQIELEVNVNEEGRVLLCALIDYEILNNLC